MTSTGANSVQRFRWHDEVGTDLVLTMDSSSCLIEVLVAELELQEIKLEILQQATDPLGLAIGPTVQIYQVKLNCDFLPIAKQSLARCWLPSHLVFPGIRDCYFRVSRET